MYQIMKKNNGMLQLSDFRLKHEDEIDLEGWDHVESFLCKERGERRLNKEVCKNLIEIKNNYVKLASLTADEMIKNIDQT